MSCAKTSHKYKLILFLDDSSKKNIDIVPNSWLSYDKARDNTYCKYMPEPYDRQKCKTLHDMIIKCAKPIPSWPEFLVDIRGRAQTYKEAEERLEILEKNAYAYTTDNEKSAKLQVTREKKSLKIKSYPDKLEKMNDILNKTCLDFDKSPLQTGSDQQSELDDKENKVKNKKKKYSKQSDQKVNTSSSSSSNETLPVSKSRNLSLTRTKIKNFKTKMKQSVQKDNTSLSSSSHSGTDSEDSIRTKKRINYLEEKPYPKKIKFNTNSCTIKKNTAVSPSNTSGQDLEVEKSLMNAGDKLQDIEIIDESKNDPQSSNVTFTVNEKSDDVIKYFQSLSKQIAHLNAQVVNNTAALKHLTVEIQKKKNCSCNSDNNEDESESISNDSDKKETEFKFPITDDQIFIKFDEKIGTDSKYKESLKSQMIHLINKKENLVKNMGHLIRTYITRDVALKYVPSHLSNVDKSKKIFKSMQFYTSVEEVLIKKLALTSTYPVDKPEILNAMKSVLRGARDWDGHGLIRKLNKIKKLKCQN